MQLFDRVCLLLCLFFTLTGFALLLPHSHDARELVRIDRISKSVSIGRARTS